jgi:hypothetical protein
MVATAIASMHQKDIPDEVASIKKVTEKLESKSVLTSGSMCARMSLEYPSIATIARTEDGSQAKTLVKELDGAYRKCKSHRFQFA